MAVYQSGGMVTAKYIGRPEDPLVSIYPLPMSEKRARHEARQARQARRVGNRLPKRHPYAWLPLWTPYWLARLVMRSQ